MWLLWFLFACGLGVLGFGVREVFLQRRLRREGVRVWGTVVRYAVSTDSEGGRSAHPVVGYDADGQWREVKFTSSGTRRPLGEQVPVVYLPGARQSGRIDLKSERRSIAIVFIAVGGVFTVAPIVILIFHLGHG